MVRFHYALIFLFDLIAIVIAGNKFNLFLSQEEVKQLLGLENELFYVRDGKINEYAIGFAIPIPSTVDLLHFTWSSPGLPLHYKIVTASSHPSVLPSPSLNISSSGLVPAQPQIWRVNVRCGGAEAAEAVITLQIELRGLEAAGNTTSLVLRRKKVCQLGTTAEDSSSSSSEQQQPRRHVPAYVIFFSAVGGCLLFIILFVSIVVIAWMRATKVKPQKCSGPALHPDIDQLASKARSVSQSYLSHSYTQLPQQSFHQDTGQKPRHLIENPCADTSLLMLSRPGAVGSSDTDSRIQDFREHKLLNSSNSTAAAPSIDSIAVDRLALTLGDLLMEGTFSRVYQGRLQLDSLAEDVMVKTVVMGSSSQQAANLVREGSLLYPLSQKHLLSLVAVTWDGSSPMLLYPYTEPGNLKIYLTSCHQPVSTHQAVVLGLQLLTALKHLHKRSLVHGDVAARNCYLSAAVTAGSSQLKLCDPALSRDLFPNDYHCLGHNENRPVKWMAVESIARDEYTSASDVWSWAVTVWEILTRAQQPFPDVDPFEMEAYLVEGFRLHQPINCPDQLYSVMASCWAHSPGHRTSVHGLYSHLSSFSSQLQEFV